MPNQSKVTADNYKQHVEERIREWVASIIWGGNANKVQEVMVFPEQYLCGTRISVETRDLICQYLLENKFAFSIVKCRDKDRKVWAMPKEPVQEPFISIRKECENSWLKAKEFYAKKAKDAIKEFADSRRRITLFKTDNSMYRQSIREELLMYPAYIVCTTYAKDWVYAVKYGAPYDKLYEDYVRYVKYVELHVKHFFDFLRFYKEREKLGEAYFEGGKLCYKVNEPARRFKTYASLAVANDFALHMRKHGFDATFFPVYEMSSYVEIGLKPYDAIPVYLEKRVKT